MLDQKDEEGRYLHYRGPDASPNCATCPCARAGRPGSPVRAFGAVGGLAIVGEGPSTEEQMQKHPFVGPSGQLLNKVLSRNGIERLSLWITNGLLCSRPSDDAAMYKAMQCCRPRLERELQDIQPTAILALGKTAMMSLRLETQSISDARGTVQTSPLFPGIPVVTSIHPAALLRGGSGEMATGGSQKQNVDAQMMFLEADIVKVHRVATGQVAPEWSDDVMVFIPPPRIQVKPAASVPVAVPVQPPAIQVQAPSTVSGWTGIIMEKPEPAAPTPAVPEEESTKPNVPPPPTPPEHQKPAAPAVGFDLRARLSGLFDVVDREINAIGKDITAMIEARVLVPATAQLAAMPPPAPASSSIDPFDDVEVDAWLKKNPDVSPALRDLYKRTNNRDLYIHIVSSVLAESM